MAALLPTALQDRLIEASGLGCGGEVVVNKLAPLHHKHRELLRVVTLVPATQYLLFSEAADWLTCGPW